MNYNKLILLFGSLLALLSVADTDVYLTNNSAQPLTIQVQHQGTSELNYGEEWQQHVQTLSLGDQGSA
ncbi:putative phospholipase C [Vibrio maritimus]|uniref:Putative phospholipase C n=1 Tax=Vibrio maritimus TaxID=990268 RepID=A0A090RZ61_9VIBR|nr:putative phospholipase C [Vibrio maritimus]